MNYKKVGLWVISFMVLLLILSMAAFFYMRYREDQKIQQIALDYQEEHSNYNIESFDECTSSYLANFERKQTVKSSDYVRLAEEIVDESKCITEQVDSFYFWYETQLVKINGLNCSLTSKRTECEILNDDLDFIIQTLDGSDFNKAMKVNTQNRVDYALCNADVSIKHTDTSGYFLEGHTQEQLNKELQTECDPILAQPDDQETESGNSEGTEGNNQEQNAETGSTDDYYDFSDTPIGERLEEIRKITKEIAYQ